MKMPAIQRQRRLRNVPSSNDKAWQGPTGAKAEVRLIELWQVVLGGIVALLLTTACAFLSPDGSEKQDPQRMNAYWNCPSATPWPSATPRYEFVDITGTPNALGTPGPVEREKQMLDTATPLPTATPYGREIRPGGRTGSQNTFYQGQDVRLGALLVNFQGMHAGSVQADGQQVWVFSFHTANEGFSPLDTWWQLQLFVREAQLPDGTTVAQSWYSTDDAQRAAGLPVWSDAATRLEPGERRDITLALLLPQGRPVAVGYTPDMVSGDTRPDVGSAANVLWFVPGNDPYCDGNTAGPVSDPDQGGAVYQRPLPPTPQGSYSTFDGWPVADAPKYITQGFGCTDFPELTGYACPSSKPYYHSGIDIGAPRGTVIRSVAYGKVVFVGPTTGTRSCASWPGSEAPHYNLGWAVYIQVGPYLIKNGHTQLNSNLQFGIEPGVNVVPGQPIALEGSTGCSSGPHLHWMIQQGSTFLDPLNFLGPNRAQRGAP